MKYYAGLDVSTKEIAICVVDEEGKIQREDVVPCEVDCICSFLRGTGLKMEKVGLESGSLSHWLSKELGEKGFTTVIMESRKMAAIMSTIINKTDKNDARGIAEALRCRHYVECIQRTQEATEIRTVLHCRGAIVKQRTCLINSLKGHLKQYGIKLGQGDTDLEERVEKSIAGTLSEHAQKAIRSLIRVIKSLTAEIVELNQIVQKIGKEDKNATILKTVDGVGDITAMAYLAEIGDPHRFKDSKDVAAYLGLTPSQYSSGEVQRQGRISKKGSKEVRTLLIEAAMSMVLNCKQWSKLKAWGMRIMSKKKSKMKAIVAVARKLAVMMHKMLITQKPFERGQQPIKKQASKKQTTQVALA